MGKRCILIKDPSTARSMLQKIMIHHKLGHFILFKLCIEPSLFNIAVKRNKQKYGVISTVAMTTSEQVLLENIYATIKLQVLSNLLTPASIRKKKVSHSIFETGLLPYSITLIDNFFVSSSCVRATKRIITLASLQTSKSIAFSLDLRYFYVVMLCSFHRYIFATTIIFSTRIFPSLVRNSRLICYLQHQSIYKTLVAVVSSLMSLPIKKMRLQEPHFKETYYSLV
jgi:hypothetical protein